MGEGESEAGCGCHWCSPRGAAAAWMCSLPLYTARSASSNCSLLHSLAGDSSSSRDLFHPRQVPAHTCLKSPFIKLSSHDPALTHHRSSAGILADTPLPTCLILQGSCPAGVTALYSWESLLARWCLCPLQFSSVTQSSPTLCDSMECSTPGLPVHHLLPELTQTHVC